jgi:hypothetical protein
MAVLESAEFPRRSFSKKTLQILRRLHLYLGLLLFPWALIYGSSGLLFNHPEFFNEQPLHYYGASEIAGTPLESRSPPSDIAAQVFEVLKSRLPDKSLQLLDVEKAKYSRDFAFAVVNTTDGPWNALFEVNGNGGTITKPKPTTKKPPETVAPFAQKEGVQAGVPLGTQFRESLPTILERKGLPSGEVRITSVPDLQFPMSVDGEPWLVSYNSLTGSVSGKPLEADSGRSLSARQFLLSLHKAHGYPSARTVRWGWAVIVDIMSVVLIFWGVSGLFMWWQIKSTRTWGLIVCLSSMVLATLLVVGMLRVL